MTDSKYTHIALLSDKSGSMQSNSMSALRSVAAAGGVSSFGYNDADREKAASKS